MFRTGSPYSPFFTSGLLYEPAPPRRGSLPTDDPAALYFTLQPKRDTSDYRSFLSLDLAESQSLRNALPKVFTFAEATPLRPRRSRDSLRTIPSPKPVPSITLPDVPAVSHSAPPLVVSRTNTPVDLPKRDSMSSVSPTIRKINRSHALARLEGRTNSTRRKAKPIKRNFMSMSDEDSEGDDEFETTTPKSPLGVINEPEDLVLPPAVPLPLSNTAPVGGRFPSSVRCKSTSSPRKRQTMTKDWFPLKSFIDLQPADDDTTTTTKFTWRSFIEVARVS